MNNKKVGFVLLLTVFGSGIAMDYRKEANENFNAMIKRNRFWTDKEIDHAMGLAKSVYVESYEMSRVSPNYFHKDLMPEDMQKVFKDTGVLHLQEKLTGYCKELYQALNNLKSCRAENAKVKKELEQLTNDLEQQRKEREQLKKELEHLKKHLQSIGATPEGSPGNQNQA